MHVSKKLIIYEEIQPDNHHYIKKYTTGLRNGNSDRKQTSRNMKNGFLWDTLTNKRTYEFNKDSVLKVKFVKFNKHKNAQKKAYQETEFSKYLEKLSTAKELHRQTPLKRSNLLSPIITKPAFTKDRLSPMKIFINKEKEQRVVSYSNRSIYKLANKFRNKSSKTLSIAADHSSKNYLDILNNAPSPGIDYSSRIPDVDGKSSLGLAKTNLTDSKFNFNLNDSSSDSSAGSEDQELIADDVFMAYAPKPTGTRQDEELKIAIK